MSMELCTKHGELSCDLCGPFKPTESYCAACRAPGYKTWRGSHPNCAFMDGGEFSRDNWSCGTCRIIRRILYDHVEEREDGMLWDSRARFTSTCRAVDYSVGSLRTDLDEDAMRAVPGVSLWLEWYKDGGATEVMVLMGRGEIIKRPTEAEVLEVAGLYQ